MRQLLKCNDLQLAQKVHEMEKYGPEDDPVLGRFRALRTDLSRMSWNSFVAALGDCDAGPLARTGVMTFPLDEGFAARLAKILLESPRTEMRRDDFAMGWVGTAAAQCEYLNACNEYRAFTPEGMALIAEFLQTIGPGLEKTLGHRFRIGSMRQFQLVPERVASGRHLDGWPVAIRKLFILPQGCGRSTSTTWFRQRDGQQLELESDKPIWVVFENSVVWHAAVSAKALRPTVEFDLLPARETSLKPFYAGLAGWYPWFPTEASLLEGTRLALAQCFPEQPDKGLKSRLRRLVGRR
ncbi:MAG: hypothetical protein JO339_34875 [Alphaproteobacteria bacterium]|nr:hypothetical protein [Alphaproteobacteria bacterium]